MNVGGGVPDAPQGVCRSCGTREITSKRSGHDGVLCSTVRNTVGRCAIPRLCRVGTGLEAQQKLLPQTLRRDAAPAETAGALPDGDCKAPYHLRKYQRLRRLNLILAVPLLLLCYILPLWIASCSAFVYMTAMMVPGMADDIHMRRATKCWSGRVVDYSTFPRP